MSCLSHENDDSWVFFWAVSLSEQGRELSSGIALLPESLVC